MRHARIERWSRGNSAIHKRHAAAKILATLALLISIASLRSDGATACGLYLVLLIGATAAARLPVGSMLRSSLAVVPFALCFAVLTALAGDPVHAVWLMVRAWLSSVAALLLIATTPMPDLLAGLEWLRAPRFLLQIMQFLYRYLVVLMEEANAMSQAGSARAGAITGLRFRQAAAMTGVLFARSYARAEAIHRAMLSRGFEGRLPVFIRASFRLSDVAFVVVAAALVIGARAV